jgi:hypothetical protein
MVRFTCDAWADRLKKGAKMPLRLVRPLNIEAVAQALKTLKTELPGTFPNDEMARCAADAVDTLDQIVCGICTPEQFAWWLRMDFGEEVEQEYRRNASLAVRHNENENRSQ